MSLQETKEATATRYGEKMQRDHYEEPTPVDKTQYASSDVQYDMEI